ncbi:MAG: hypothetical protein MZV64_09160 [Ignavibacteriales bacterium]|nr:hypothetical protein [Ignavibacteriales bacterium]
MMAKEKNTATTRRAAKPPHLPWSLAESKRSEERRSTIQTRGVVIPAAHQKIGKGHTYDDQADCGSRAAKLSHHAGYNRNLPWTAMDTKSARAKPMTLGNASCPKYKKKKFDQTENTVMDAFI